MRQRLDTYDELPRGMRKYLSHNGWHFNKRACDYAVGLMRRRNPSTGKAEPIEPITKDTLEERLHTHGIMLEHLTGYDHVYVVNMAKADFWGTSIVDEAQLCRYVKDVVDDIDQADGYIFNRWLADMCINGIPIEWEELL